MFISSLGGIPVKHIERGKLMRMGKLIFFMLTTVILALLFVQCGRMVYEVTGGAPKVAHPEDNKKGLNTF